MQGHNWMNHVKLLDPTVTIVMAKVETDGWQNPAPLWRCTETLKNYKAQKLCFGAPLVVQGFCPPTVLICVYLYTVYIYICICMYVQKNILLYIYIYIWIYSLSIHIIYDIVLIHKSFFATWVIQTRISSRWFSVAWRTSRVVQLSASSLPMRTRFCGNRQDEHWNSIRREMGKL